MKVLFVADSAVARSGPQRNMIGRLNALTSIPELKVSLLAGEVDPHEPYYNRLYALYNDFKPHSLISLPRNIIHFNRAAKGKDIIYISRGLKPFLYAQLFRKRYKLVAGPNITGLPPRKSNPYPFMIEHMCDAWMESSKFRKQMAILGGNKPNHINIIPHAVDLEQFTVNKKEKNFWKKYNLSDQTKKVLFVCSEISRPRKGLKYVLDAFCWYGSQLTGSDLIVVGKDKHKLADKYAGQARIHFLGPRYGQELAEIYANSHFLILPTMTEGCPNVILEAMASGLVVISNDIDGVPELVTHNSNGILLKLCKEKEIKQADGLDILDREYREGIPLLLANALEQLLHDESRYLRMSVAARQRMEEYFNECRLGQDLFNLFRKVLAGKRFVEDLL